jgi:hypothetical protein
MVRHVKGSLFRDYARMLKARKGFDWSPYLPPDDLAYLDRIIDEAGWYPMATFERFGLAILKMIADDDLEAVRLWGQSTARTLATQHRGLVVEDAPRESLMRFHVLRRTFFDFEAAAVLSLQDDEVRVQLAYAMSPVAEEAASYQTMGFFEGLVELAGGGQVTARFNAQSWRGGATTTLVLGWVLPPRRDRDRVPGRNLCEREEGVR